GRHHDHRVGQRGPVRTLDLRLQRQRLRAARGGVVGRRRQRRRPRRRVLVEPERQRARRLVRAALGRRPVVQRGGDRARVPDAAALATLRTQVLDGAGAAALLAERGLAFDPTALVYFAHWITPSIEPKRFSARFYVAALPPGQEPRFDDRETVDQCWVTPAAA